ncbi:unnamed protein product [Caenorhabditis bovis]|uniref:Uncharacterized protein n=1 Tax=Caenorhabditis bovis TaxID=2654633 RepID=A0A8S1EEK0_9PELO|nr:unnamed protein product [Caenorhabditis bovis]
MEHPVTPLCHIIRRINNPDHAEHYRVRSLDFDRLIAYKSTLVPNFLTEEHRSVNRMIDRVAAWTEVLLTDIYDYITNDDPALVEQMVNLEDEIILLALAIDRLAFMVTEEHPILHVCEH